MRNYLIMALILISLSGCGKQQVVEEIPATNSADNSAFSDSDRDLSYKAEFLLETDQSDSVHNQVVKLAEIFDGYVLKATLDKTIIRIRANYLVPAVDSVSLLGKVIKKEITGTDVTDAYVDYRLRLDNALEIREKYLSLLKTNKSGVEIFKLQTELERLNQKIENLEGKIFQIEHRIEYAEISVSTNDRIKPGLIGGLLYGIGKGFVSLFVR